MYRITIKPINGEVINIKCNDYCKDVVDGEEYLYTGKTRQSASSSFPLEIVKSIIKMEVE